MRVFSSLMFVAGALLLGPLLAVPAAGCDVPVFRYALERWPPDAYHAVVFHRGALDAEGRAALDQLRAAAAPQAGRANLVVHTADLAAEMTAASRTLWQGQPPNAALPRLVLLYPTTMTGDRLVWAGPFSAETARALHASPARREIARHITDGGTGVWVLLESGDAARDEAAARTIGDQLARMPQLLTLPPELSAKAPHLAARLKIEFALVRLGRSDPAEQVFAAMLLGSEPDLRTAYAGAPIAFAVFGRGRLLFAAVGDGITAENVLLGCRQLLARCSCEVKDEYPGVDLLFDVPWQSAIGFSMVDLVDLPSPIAEDGSTAAPGNDPAADRAPAADPASAAARSQTKTTATASAAGSSDGGGPLFRNILVALGFIVAAVALLLLRLARRPQRR